ncbi:hypothetical protein W97_00564 [Coniosporium apollinis CBS 100218]|uniref:RNA helicase n=1 Tax=Coniosporium apollinis (strain CBS 100218) TaxID=1168221 RepID=R7YHG6_CONA1|nr:uncharacterized protein W97_00564 [Coniosporium apollinis CBS 100218]EON61350.1 hypothetical protein W97_00564 [Coniosporium apollinis CBS 100218]
MPSIPQRHNDTHTNFSNTTRQHSYRFVSPVPDSSTQRTDRPSKTAVKLTSPLGLTMARGGNTRSPSPTGSSYSRRSRRDDDRPARDRRDDVRSYRRRSRSRSPDRRYRDRDAYRRADRPVDRRDDRRDDRDNRSSRRDRSRERRRSRERSPDRERRRRSRDRDYRDRRDDSRDRDRARRDAPPDSRPKPRREDSRERNRDRDRATSVKAVEASKPATPSKQSEEEKKKVERLAKLEAWKAKQAAALAQKQKESEAAEGKTLLDQMDRKAAASPSVASPMSPTVTTPALPSGNASPAPYAGKFDPKAIAKKATGSSTNANALGIDVSVPVNLSYPFSTSSTPLTPVAAAAPLRPLKAHGNLSGFGLVNKAPTDSDKGGQKKTLDFGDEESTRKKLEKLPTPPLEDGIRDDTARANGAEEEEGEDDDVDMADAGTEEEIAAAARAAAERRDEQLANDSRAEAQTNGDVHMEEASADIPNGEPMEEEEDVDPLDAFMSGLGDPIKPTRASAGSGALKGKGAMQEPEAMFGDEDEMKTLENNPDDILAMASKRKKKDIPTINHAKMNYEPFRKSFYNEPTELVDMTEEELADLRLELDGIKVRGVDVPKPIQKWAQCGLGVQTLDVIRKLGYQNPTSIQAQAIPAIMSGRDVIGVAKTGSGKTIAFLLPMFRHIKDQRPLDSLDGPIGLIMTPTRELAVQIHKECKPFLKALNLRAVCAYGGAPIKDQIAELKRGAEIVVCTPGRIIDLLAANSGRVTNLRRVTYVVLDEADRMFDMGFEPQVMKILANIRPQRQTVLFSATFPRNMEALARKTLTKPVEIIVGGRSVVAPEITQLVEVRLEDKKFHRLLELLGELYDKDDDARTLIFVDRQEAADQLLGELMRKSYQCRSIHGGIDQIDRDSAIDDFKKGEFPIMIATSVAARGLDVKQLKLVVNYDAPNHLEDYVHRAGRTGRAGNTGTAVTFLTPEQERYAVHVAKALRQSGQDVPEPVQKLVDSFQEKVKAGKEKFSGSGFGGKGLERLDAERDATRNRERKTYKTGEGDEEEEKEDKEEDDKILVKAKGTPAAAAPEPKAPIPGVPKGIDLDNFVVHKTEKPDVSNDPLAKAQAAKAAIDNRLSQKGQLRLGQPIDNKGPDAGAFHATLEINDFPQKARWAVTNRTNVAKILDSTGTSITTKGSYYPPGKEVELGKEPKLYILVEGDTENVVTNAMRELLRLLKDGTIAAADSEARAPQGRYSVV